MGIFVNEKDNVDVKVKYVFDKVGVIHILSDGDYEMLSLPDEEKKEEAPEYDSVNVESSIPLNSPIKSIMDYTKDDICVLSAVFRKPNFSNMTELMASIDIDSEGNVRQSSVYDFSNRRLSLLFKNGKLQDENKKFFSLNSGNIGSLDPILGGALMIALNVAMGSI